MASPEQLSFPFEPTAPVPGRFGEHRAAEEPNHEGTAPQAPEERPASGPEVPERGEDDDEKICDYCGAPLMSARMCQYCKGDRDKLAYLRSNKRGRGE